MKEGCRNRLAVTSTCSTSVGVKLRQSESEGERQSLDQTRMKYKRGDYIYLLQLRQETADEKNSGPAGRRPKTSPVVRSSAGSTSRSRGGKTPEEGQKSCFDRNHRQATIDREVDIDIHTS